MKAVYYRIFNKFTNVTLLEGIISTPEDTIYPSQQMDDVENYPDAPSECEACKFKSESAEIELIGFEVTQQYIMQNKTKSAWY